MTRSAPEQLTCFHCGDFCNGSKHQLEDKVFCCAGCLRVYEMLHDNDLCGYYIDNAAGSQPTEEGQLSKFAFLDSLQATKDIIKFQNGKQTVVEWYLPQMHCASCVWLLENLAKLNDGIVSSRVHFLSKSITISFNSSVTTLREIAVLLSRIGYEPHFDRTETSDETTKQSIRQTWLQIGLTGFCFANIMMLSLPEYLGLNLAHDQQLASIFRWLAWFISLPALWFGGKMFFQNAIRSLQHRQLHIDLGIALSVALTFSRSTFEIFTQTGSGYLDSMTGILFFMHIGRYFQNKTHEHIHFDLRYKHFFPLHVQRIGMKGETESIAIQNIQAGDLLEIRSQEIIPVDAVCLVDNTTIDYSFVTGESDPVAVKHSAIIYAGGRNSGGSILLKVIKGVDQNYLSSLWNINPNKATENSTSQSDRIGTYFTITLIGISLAAFLYWLPTSSVTAWSALTTVLIVACPCSLLLSTTFTHGMMLRYLARYQIFLKNAQILERLTTIDHVVFDKTGTITGRCENKQFVGSTLSSKELEAIVRLARQSQHPYSKSIAQLPIPANTHVDVAQFREIPGKGISAFMDGIQVKLGSAEFVGASIPANGTGAQVYVAFNSEVKGYFQFEQYIRVGLEQALKNLAQTKPISLLSGDMATNQVQLKSLTAVFQDMRFSQTPAEKKEYIQSLQAQGKVMMIGDGLNDVGALAQSDIGIAISDKSNHFTPACDILIAGSSFYHIPQLFQIALWSRRIIHMGFGLSLLYNSIGLYFATQGLLAPWVAAILMPLSSISILLFTRFASWLLCQISLKSDPDHTVG